MTQNILTEITERKQLEEDLKLSKEFYYHYFETSHDCIFITSANGNLIEVNSAGMELFGLSLQDKEDLQLTSVASFYNNPEGFYISFNFDRVYE